MECFAVDLGDINSDQAIEFHSDPDVLENVVFGFLDKGQDLAVEIMLSIMVAVVGVAKTAQRRASAGGFAIRQRSICEAWRVFSGVKPACWHSICQF
jgi:hypothetical protein